MGGERGNPSVVTNRTMGRPNWQRLRRFGANIGLGCGYVLGLLGAKRMSIRSFYWAGRRGLPHAQYCMGKRYAEGYGGVKIDERVAAAWFRRAALQGHRDAQGRLGFLLLRGRGVREDEAEAYRWLTSAVRLGDVWACCTLGNMYDSEYAHAAALKDDSVAAMWYSRGAEKGNGACQVSLARLYQEGRGVDQDYDESMKWILRAANSGVREGWQVLGKAYEQGHGVPQDSAKARLWYRKAALACMPHLESWLDLARSHDEAGRPIKGYACVLACLALSKFFKISPELLRHAEELRAQFRTKLTSDPVRRAEKLANAFSNHVINRGLLPYIYCLWWVYLVAMLVHSLSGLGYSYEDLISRVVYFVVYLPHLSVLVFITRRMVVLNLEYAKILCLTTVLAVILRLAYGYGGYLFDGIEPMMLWWHADLVIAGLQTAFAFRMRQVNRLAVEDREI